MKKHLVLTIAIFNLLACSSDNEKNLDIAVGSWYLFSENNKEVSTCENKNTLVFNENGTFSETYYSVHTNNDCISDDGIEGNWSNKGDGSYGFTSYKTDEVVVTIIFSDNNNTLTFTQENAVYKRK